MGHVVYAFEEHDQVVAALAVPARGVDDVEVDPVRDPGVRGVAASPGDRLFGNSADDYLKVHDQGPDHADVTEGSGGIWERLYYDWSDPRQVVLTTTDSNTWGGRSGYTYAFTRQPDGTTVIDERTAQPELDITPTLT